ncbi:MAG TPA: hypothetical protein VHO26_04955 [Propionibacteriaceae bacterium]|nr:hypothetical protein [Propionibacteriaceae bacterium]
MRASVHISRAAGAILGSVVAVAVLAAGTTPALAATHHHGHAAPRRPPVPRGIDVSYPQCGRRLPRSTSFAVVGVNDGVANTLNPCFGTSSAYPSYRQSELYWALTAARGRTRQPRVSLYVNTAAPGSMYHGRPVRDWPTSGRTPYGPCYTTRVHIHRRTVRIGQVSRACSWRYGYQRATQDAAWLRRTARSLDRQQHHVRVSDAPSHYGWWLDVETSSLWRGHREMNVAVLQGMVAGLRHAGVRRIGVYSTQWQWDAITGGSRAGSLHRLATWVPGAPSLGAARSRCGRPTFTGGRVSLTQWFGALDGDYSC